jgi:hypothetical protein
MVGFSYVLILFVASILQSTLLHHYFFLTYNVGMQVGFFQECSSPPGPQRRSIRSVQKIIRSEFRS